MSYQASVSIPMVGRWRFSLKLILRNKLLSIVCFSTSVCLLLPKKRKKEQKKQRKKNPVILLGYILQIRTCNPTRSPHSLTAGCDDSWYQVMAVTATSIFVITPLASIFLWHTFMSLYLFWFWNTHSHDTLLLSSKHLIVMESVIMKEGNMSSCLEKTARNTLMLKTSPVWRIVNGAEINVSETLFGMMFFCSYVALG